MPNREIDEEVNLQTAQMIKDPEARRRYLDQICEGDLNLQRASRRDL